MSKTKRYTADGTVFYQKAVSQTNWCVQVNFNLGGGGAAFKTVMWANKGNNWREVFGLQETTESPEMHGWEIATPADIILYADTEVAKNIEKIQAMIRLGYKGQHHTKTTVMDEIEWKMSQ